MDWRIRERYSYEAKNLDDDDDPLSGCLPVMAVILVILFAVVLLSGKVSCQNENESRHGSTHVTGIIPKPEGGEE